MKKISISIIKEIIPIFLVANFFFIFLMLIEQVIQLAELLFVHSVPFSIVIKIFLCYMPSFMVITIPISALLSSLLAFSRFSADSELVAMYACGASKYQLSKPVFAIGVVILISCLINSFILLPKGSKMAVNSINEMLQNLSVNDIQEKEMYNGIEGIIFYADKKIDKANFENVVFIYSSQNAVITSKKATIMPSKTKSLVMDFYDGRFIMNNNQQDYTTINFGLMSMNFPLNLQVESMPESERLLSAAELKKRLAEPAYKYEYYKRYSQSVAALVMIMFGFYLGLFFERSGRSWGLVISGSVAVIYNVLFVVGANFITDLNPAVIAWFPDILLTTLLFSLIYKTRRS